MLCFRALLKLSFGPQQAKCGITQMVDPIPVLWVQSRHDSTRGTTRFPMVRDLGAWSPQLPPGPLAC